MGLKYEQYALTGSAIEDISLEVQNYLIELDCESKQLQRIRLTVEELLLRLREKIMEDSKNRTEEEFVVNIAIGKHMGKHMFKMYYDGEPMDPTSFDEEDELATVIMPALGLAPFWNYNKGKNNVTLVFSEKKTKGAVFGIVMAIVVAAVLGALGRFIPEETLTTLCDGLLTPLIDGFFGLLKTFAGIMIGFTTVNAISGIDDSQTFGALGKRVLFRMIGSTFIISGLSLFACALILGLPFGGGEIGDQSAWSDIGGMLFNMIPSNPVDPFLQGNTIQIMVISVFLGIGLISIGERGRHFRKLVEDGTALTQTIVSMITGLISVCVCLMILRMIWSGSTNVLLGGWKPLILIVVGELIVMAVMAVITGLKTRQSPLSLAKKALPAYVVALTSATSLSAMTLGMDISEKEMGVEKRTVGFAYPLGVVLYKGSTAFTSAAMLCAMADIYNVEISIPWMITAVVTVALLNIAMPPIPGAGVMVYTMMYAKLGVPAEAIALSMAIETIVDHTDTGGNTMVLILKLAREAKQRYLLD